MAMPSSGSRAIEIKAVTIDVEIGRGRTLSSLRLLEDACMHVNRGEHVALSGPSGSGKTTLLQAIAGILPTRSKAKGEIFVGATRVLPSGRRETEELRATRLGYVAQHPAVFGRLTVAENVGYASRLLGRKVDRSAIALALEQAGLRIDPDRVAAGLSGGEQKRLALASALLGPTAPEVLLLDEPTAGLHVEDRAGLNDLLSRLAAQGTAVLVATHEDTSAQRRIAMADGHILRGSGA
ncbi:MAG: ATP-binding cassette domain-containing protein [Actinobacteria bacterium]|nr:ATP-binding cassette domain-containing protein [Actinomycetota bacterium]